MDTTKPERWQVYAADLLDLMRKGTLLRKVLHLSPFAECLTLEQAYDAHDLALDAIRKRIIQGAGVHIVSPEGLTVHATYLDLH